MSENIKDTSSAKPNNPDLSKNESTRKKLIKMLMLICYVLVLAFFFAKVEIQIEGPEGWAASLPTWRIEKAWWLDIFWGGRPMTGYHAWIFSFIFLIFHIPAFIFSKWNFQIELRILACIELFWLVEDFLWFILNPAYGIAKFSPEYIWWHKNWIAFMPTDYWTFTIISILLFYFSFLFTTKKKKASSVL